MTPLQREYLTLDREWRRASERLDTQYDAVLDAMDVVWQRMLPTERQAAEEFVKADRERQDVLRSMAWLLMVLGLAVAVFLLAEVALAQAPPGFSVFADGFETTDPCVDPMVEPEGWARATWTWERQWSAPNGSATAVYPNSIGSPIPLGANRNGYRVIPFVPEPNQSISVTWDVVQAYPSIGYTQPRPSAAMWIAISTCAGDLRLPSQEGDPYLRAGCRKFSDKGGISFSDSAPVSDHQVCKVTPRVQHYMTVTPHWPEDGPETDTCLNDTAPVCHVGAVHRNVQ